jgi:hypothetical protein
VAIPLDVEQLQARVLSHSKAESVVCVGLYALPEAELARLRQADAIFFVVSATSMCSTAYQMLLFATFPLIDSGRCRVLNLDGAQVPLGAPMLRDLPDCWPV